MHIPDGFLDARTAAATAALSVIGLGAAMRWVRRTFPPQRVPLIGLAAAFIFAAQMLNFPVAGGTSGHLIGAVLAVVLLGPSAAVLALSAVLILQCFMFADGGVTALGANLFNMALVAPVAGYAVYLPVSRVAGRSLRGRLLATAVAAWCSTVAAAIACAAELAMSGTVAWKAGLPAMMGIHMLIGMGEALITTLVVAAVARTRPDLLAEGVHAELRPRYRELAVYGLLVSVGLLVFIAPFASSLPDGLERVAATLGFEGRAAAAPVAPAPLPGYTMPGIHSPGLTTVLAGLAGLAIAFVTAFALARALARPASVRGPGPVNPGASALPFVARLAATLLFIGTVVLLPRTAWTAYAGAAALLLAAVLLSRLPAGMPIKRLLCLEPFVIGVSLLSLFQPGGLPIFFALLTKSTLCLGAMVLLAAATPFVEILEALKALRVPAILLTTLALMYRYLFLLTGETHRMQRARRSRAFTDSRRHAWSSLATVAAHLFVRTSERAEHIYAAMCARGWRT